MFNPARFIDAPETARMGVGGEKANLDNNALALRTYAGYLTTGPPIGDNYLLDVGTCDIGESHDNCAPPDENGTPEETGTVCGREYNSLEERDTLISELVKEDKDPEGNTIRKCKKFVRMNNLPRGKSVNIAGIEVHLNGLLSAATDDLLDLENASSVLDNKCSVIEAEIDHDREEENLREEDIKACEGQGKKYNEDCGSIPNGKCMTIDDRLTCVSMPKPQKKIQWCGPMLDKAKCSGDQATNKCSDNKEIGVAEGGGSRTDNVKDLFLLILLILLLIIYFFSVNKLNKN